MEVVQYHGDLRAQVSKLIHRPSLSKISLIFWTCCAGHIRYYTLILAKRPRSDMVRGCLTDPSNCLYTTTFTVFFFFPLNNEMNHSFVCVCFERKGSIIRLKKHF